MTDDHIAAMNQEEIDEFLGRGGTGVISLAKENVPYSIPVSYGYDAEKEVFYLRLGYTPDSDKRAFLEATAQARLVVYEQTQDTWKSVVAIGDLEEISTEEIDTDIVTQLRKAERPLFEMWDESREDLTFMITRFGIESIDGRKTQDGRLI